MLTHFFPPLKFSECNSIECQLAHIQEEFIEVRQAHISETPERVAEELADLATSAITGLHILQRTHGIDPVKVLEMVVEKNRKRGYAV